MNILFLTMADIYSIDEHDIYQDLMRKFISQGDSVYVVSPVETRKNINTSLIEGEGCKILKVRVGNQSDCSLIEKGISTVTINQKYYKAIKKYYKDIQFDMILYTTPPVTVAGVVSKLKKRSGAFAYLMLKDIFPQNAVDLGMIGKNGAIYRYFRLKEKFLYKISDYIGCMSPANVKFLTENNNVDTEKIGMCPNAFEVFPLERYSQEEIISVRSKYDVPEDKTVFIYGGNLGKPQGIEFFLNCLEAAKTEEDAFFVVVGGGSEYGKIKSFIEEREIKNVKLFKKMSRDEYYSLVKAADVGMVFLDYRFTIPNVPSRMLSYMENGLPVAFLTDRCTDAGSIAVDGEFGWQGYSNDTNSFLEIVKNACNSDLMQMGDNAYRCMKEKYSVDVAYEEIMAAYRKYRG